MSGFLLENLFPLWSLRSPLSSGQDPLPKQIPCLIGWLSGSLLNWLEGWFFPILCPFKFDPQTRSSLLCFPHIAPVTSSFPKTYPIQHETFRTHTKLIFSPLINQVNYFFVSKLLLTFLVMALFMLWFNSNVIHFSAHHHSVISLNFSLLLLKLRER